MIRPTDAPVLLSYTFLSCIPKECERDVRHLCLPVWHDLGGSVVLPRHQLTGLYIVMFEIIPTFRSTFSRWPEPPWDVCELSVGRSKCSYTPHSGPSVNVVTTTCALHAHWKNAGWDRNAGLHQKTSTCERSSGGEDDAWAGATQKRVKRGYLLLCYTPLCRGSESLVLSHLI